MYVQYKEQKMLVWVRVEDEEAEEVLILSFTALPLSLATQWETKEVSYGHFPPPAHPNEKESNIRNYQIKIKSMSHQRYTLARHV